MANQVPEGERTAAGKMTTTMQSVKYGKAPPDGCSELSVAGRGENEGPAAKVKESQLCDIYQTSRKHHWHSKQDKERSQNGQNCFRHI